MMPPLTCAMPDVMTHISSDCVMRLMNGRMVSGASVCPMKTDAATFRLSAPLAPISLVITFAKARTMTAITPEVVQDREQRGDEDDRRQHLEREDEPDGLGADGPAALDAKLAEDEFGADEGKVEQAVDLGSHPLEEDPAPGRLEHHQGQSELKAQAPEHRLEPDGRTVG